MQNIPLIFFTPSFKHHIILNEIIFTYRFLVCRHLEVCWSFDGGSQTVCWLEIYLNWMLMFRDVICFQSGGKKQSLPEFPKLYTQLKVSASPIPVPTHQNTKCEMSIYLQAMSCLSASNIYFCRLFCRLNKIILKGTENPTNTIFMTFLQWLLLFNHFTLN